MADGPNTTIVERRGGSGAAIFIGIVLLIAVAIGAFYLFNKGRNDNMRTDAVVSAADKVGDTAKKAGDAVDPGK